MNLLQTWYFTEPHERARWPECSITLHSAGSMKPGRDDDNRQRVFRACGVDPKSVVSLNQTHSRIVRIAMNAHSFTGFPDGDGIMTTNRELVPCVSVADCMPIWLFDPVTGCFGALHSGWKGTGILRTALELAADEWNAKPSDFHVILGPHIRSCCYTVDKERAEYFIRSFGPSCVTLDPERLEGGNQWPYRLSLAEANLLLCDQLGIPRSQVADLSLCTSCDSQFGSNRREGAGCFTNMAAFIRWR